MSKRPIWQLKRDLLAILQFAGRGRENAIPLAHLGTEMHLSWREVAQVIEAARADGHLIGTARGKNPGAFWPVTRDDQEAALRPYALAFYRMSQIYSRLKKVARRAVVEAVERKIQQELFHRGERGAGEQ